MDERAKILIVDDEESIRKTLKAILEEQGYLVDTAKNGKEAVEKSKARFYNLALVDIKLPDIEGTKLLTTMIDTLPRMVKIIVTGYPSLQNAIDSVNKGADAYIRKPFNIEAILEIIRSQLRRQQEERKFDEAKVAEFITSRTKELDSTT